LASAGANVQDADQYGRTLLIHAIDLNNIALVRALLQEGANPNAMLSPVTGTPLQHALEKRYINIELLLRQYGAKE